MRLGVLGSQVCHYGLQFNRNKYFEASHGHLLCLMDQEYIVCFVVWEEMSMGKGWKEIADKSWFL